MKKSRGTVDELQRFDMGLPQAEEENLVNDLHIVDSSQKIMIHQEVLADKCVSELIGQSHYPSQLLCVDII